MTRTLTALSASPRHPPGGLVDFDRWCVVTIGVAVLLQCVAILVMANQGKRILLPAQWARLAATIAFDAYVSFTEIGRLGHVLTWRLPIGNVAMIFACYGLAKQLGSLRNPDYPASEYQVQVPLMVRRDQEKAAAGAVLPSTRRIKTGMVALAVAFLSLALSGAATWVALSRISQQALDHEEQKFCAVFGTLQQFKTPTAAGQRLVKEFHDIYTGLKCPATTTRLPVPTPTPAPHD